MLFPATRSAAPVGHPEDFGWRGHAQTALVAETSCIMPARGPPRCCHSLIPNPSQPPDIDPLLHPSALMEIFSILLEELSALCSHPIPAPLGTPCWYLVAEGVALVALLPQGGAHPQPPQPEADGAAGPTAALRVPLTGLGRGTRRGLVQWVRNGLGGAPRR